MKQQAVKMTEKWSFTKFIPTLRHKSGFQFGELICVHLYALWIEYFAYLQNQPPRLGAGVKDKFWSERSACAALGVPDRM